LELGNGGNEVTGTTYGAVQKLVQRRHLPSHLTVTEDRVREES